MVGDDKVGLQQGGGGGGLGRVMAGEVRAAGGNGRAEDEERQRFYRFQRASGHWALRTLNLRRSILEARSQD